MAPPQRIAPKPHPSRPLDAERLRVAQMTDEERRSREPLQHLAFSFIPVHAHGMEQGDPVARMNAQWVAEVIDRPPPPPLNDC